MSAKKNCVSCTKLIPQAAVACVFCGTRQPVEEFRLTAVLGAVNPDGTPKIVIPGLPLPPAPKVAGAAESQAVSERHGNVLAAASGSSASTVPGAAGVAEPSSVMIAAEPEEVQGPLLVSSPPPLRSRPRLKRSRRSRPLWR